MRQRGFRNRLVTWEQRWKHQWFGTSKANLVVTGRDGWLFLGGKLMISDTIGNMPFSDGELEAWRDLIQGRRDWLAQRGIRYLFVVAPDKHSIYPEQLPEWLSKAARPPHRIDQFMAYMKAHGDLPVVDVRPPLLETKKNTPVYFQTDAHWNDLGGFIGTREIVQRASALGLDIQPVELSAFDVSQGNGACGDIARLLNARDGMTENTNVSLAPKPPLPTVTTTKPPGLLARNWASDKSPILSENAAAKLKAVMFHDSFATSISKYLGYSFGRITYVWQQNWDKELIETERPDIVIDEMVERFVLARDPKLLKKLDEQPAAHATENL